MAASSGPKVVGIVDEAKGVVMVGVEHNGQLLPVASKNLDSAMAVGLDKKGEPSESDASESEGK